MSDQKRLIEVAFPLKQTSLDAVHEKNVRHGHISTLHIWPARRPLAAARAALAATLLPDPGDDEERKALLKRLGGEVRESWQTQKAGDGALEEQRVETTVGGILHWGRENSPDLAWFREQIRAAYGGRAPRVLDPFAGGGAIPLEAMRLGCAVTAVDINPVAWFVLKCTLEYPQRLAGKTLPLPDFALADADFMAALRKAHGQGSAAGAPRKKGKAAQADTPVQGALFAAPEADLAWHVRAWGLWVLEQARRELAPYYPVVDGQPTVAYLWARTVTCKHCRATLPLLKTRWLCKKERKRVVLTMTPNADRSGVAFGILDDAPQGSGGSAARKAHDKQLGAGTMSRAGATCPCCGLIMTSEDIRTEGQAGRLGQVMTAVVVEGKHGKEYRRPSAEEVQAAAIAPATLDALFAQIPFGMPDEPVPQGGSRTGGGSPFTVHLYGMDQWRKLFTSRQFLALGALQKATHAMYDQLRIHSYAPEWREALTSYLACSFSRFLDFSNTAVQWKVDASTINHSLVRFALPLVWDFAEGNPIGDSAGSFLLCYQRICTALDTFSMWQINSPSPKVEKASATQPISELFDVVITDPPYYDAIPYSDLMDFFYVWLRRLLYPVSTLFEDNFREPLSPKWDHAQNDGELIDDASRHDGDKEKSKQVYEHGMFQAFRACFSALSADGRMVVVFAHKNPDAWEALVSAIIRAGFVVDGSWPIQTEQTSRSRAISSAALSSSVWLVCKKRAATARAGWDNVVLADMRQRIRQRLRDFWDAGIRGPDFVWAATGPALEAYSLHPIVKKANEPGALLTVAEFLEQVRRLVVEFVVGRVLGSDDGDAEAAGLDPVTTYYLLHRHDFGLAPAPAGACILYALSCGVSDRALADQYDLVTGGGSEPNANPNADREGGAGDGDDDAPDDEGGAATLRLKPWSSRKRKNLGEPGAGGRPAPLIDQIHRLLWLWKAGDAGEVDAYIDAQNLRQQRGLAHVLQSLIELAGGEERALLESISNHVAARGAGSRVAALQ
jgi:putative DNA methylase